MRASRLLTAPWARPSSTTRTSAPATRALAVASEGWTRTAMQRRQRCARRRGPRAAPLAPHRVPDRQLLRTTRAHMLQEVCGGTVSTGAAVSVAPAQAVLRRARAGPGRTAGHATFGSTSSTTPTKSAASSWTLLRGAPSQSPAEAMTSRLRQPPTARSAAGTCQIYPSSNANVVAHLQICLVLQRLA